MEQRNMQSRQQPITSNFFTHVLLLLLLVAGQIHLGTGADTSELAVAALHADTPAAATHDADGLGSSVREDRHAVEGAGLQEQSMSSGQEESSSTWTTCGSVPISNLPLLITSTSSFIVLNAYLNDNGNISKVRTGR
jgi:hypothetical protein